MILNANRSAIGYRLRMREGTRTDRQTNGRTDRQAHTKTDSLVYNLALVDYQHQHCQRQPSSACNIRPMSAARRAPETEKAIYINRLGALSVPCRTY